MLKLLEGIKTLCVAQCNAAKTGVHWSVFLAADMIIAASRRLYSAGYSLEDIFALDTTDGFLVIYHFNRWHPNERVALRVLVARHRPVIPSIASVYQGAEWHERETRDFYGIVFEGNPNFVPLLLPAEEPDLHPLVKSETARLALKDLMDPGRIVTCSPEIEKLFAAPDPPPQPE